MEARAQWNVQRPLSISNDEVEAMDRVAQKYLADTIRGLVIDAELDPNKIKSAADLNRHRSIESQVLQRKIADLGEPRWSIKFTGGLEISGLTAAEVLGQPNGQDREFQSLSLKAGRWDRALQCEFHGDSYRGTFWLEIDGEHDAVESARSALRRLVLGSVRPWWIVRNEIFGVVCGIAAVVFVLSILAVVTELEEGVSAVPNFGLLLKTILGVGGVAFLYAVLMVFGWWKRIFPNTEYLWGAGLKRDGVRAKLRWILIYVVPVAAVVTPYLRNLVG